MQTLYKFNNKCICTIIILLSAGRAGLQAMIYMQGECINTLFLGGRKKRKTMAEQEIINHTKKAYKVWHSKEHSFWHKLKEFMLEIVIIVFAVTVSIWLHNWSEHHHEQEQVKDFLVDVKGDLERDIETITRLRSNLNEALEHFADLQALTSARIDSFASVHKTIQLNTDRIFREAFQANYEGFKSSGKIALIENKKLKKELLEYNQETLQNLKEEENAYNDQMVKTTDYAAENIEKSDKDLLLNPRFKVILRLNLQWGARLQKQYTDALDKANELLKEIGKQVKE